MTKQITSHGFVLDEKGRKMSKSLGNVVDPETITEGKGSGGVDLLRCWVSASDFTTDMSVGPTTISTFILMDQQLFAEQCQEILQKIRNTFRFMIGNLHQFTENDCISKAHMIRVN